MTAIAVQLHLNTSYGSKENPAAGIIAGRVGSPGIPMLPTVALPPGEWPSAYTGAECTTTGPVCGECTDSWPTLATPVRHATAAHVRTCHDVTVMVEADQAAEWPLTRAGIL